MKRFAVIVALKVEHSSLEIACFLKITRLLSMFAKSRKPLTGVLQQFPNVKRLLRVLIPEECQNAGLLSEPSIQLICPNGYAHKVSSRRDGTASHEQRWRCRASSSGLKRQCCWLLKGVEQSCYALDREHEQRKIVHLLRRQRRFIRPRLDELQSPWSRHTKHMPPSIALQIWIRWTSLYEVWSRGKSINATITL